MITLRSDTVMHEALKRFKSKSTNNFILSSYMPKYSKESRLQQAQSPS